MKYALTAKQSVLFTYLSFLGCEKKYFKEALDMDYTFLECLVKDDDIFWDFEKDISFNKVFLKSRTLNQAIHHFNSCLSKETFNLEKTTQKIAYTQKWETDSISTLKELLTEYIEAYIHIMPFLFHFWNVEHLLLMQLKNDFIWIFGEQEADQLLQQVLTPLKDTYFSKERQNLEEILMYIYAHPILITIFQKNSVEKTIKRLEEHTTLKNMIEIHIKAYAFTTTSLQMGNPLSLHPLVERIKLELKNNTKDAILSRQRQTTIDREKIQKIITQLSDFPDIHERIAIAQELIFWRNERLDTLSKCDLLIRPLFEKLATLMNLTYEQFISLTYEEIKQWFLNKKILPNKKDLNMRTDKWALYLKNGKINLFINKKDYPIVVMNEEKIIPKKSSSQSYGKIKGTTAFLGKVVGKVRLVNTSSDIKYVQKGEILVTKMTRPDMILGLEKAAAFVTDQGGMLSHAAIVAREMQKPCIVGTKNATKLLRDGNIVEVNANEGYVFILK